jgi:hypothetical protein
MIAARTSYAICGRESRALLVREKWAGEFLFGEIVAASGVEGGFAERSAHAPRAPVT